MLGPHSLFFVQPPFIKTSSYAPAILDLNAISAVPENCEDTEFTMPWYRFRTPVSISNAVLVSGYQAVVECKSMLDLYVARIVLVGVPSSSIRCAKGIPLKLP